jgi:hypothetical protein
MQSPLFLTGANRLLSAMRHGPSHRVIDTPRSAACRRSLVFVELTTTRTLGFVSPK